MAKDTVHTLATRREYLINYLKLRLEEENWQMILVLIMELIEIDAKLKVME